MKSYVPESDIVMITLDTLRYDVAQEAWSKGELPGLAPFLGSQGWQRRHTPASFTYAAHQAFFSGFLPTPAHPGIHVRRFAAEFAGSTTLGPDTFCFQQASLPEALAARGYHTVCIGGTGFFNKTNALSRVLPSLFLESHWEPRMGVTDPRSEHHQVMCALNALKDRDRVFLFLNMAALHQPNWFYGYEERRPDDKHSHGAALRAVDEALTPLWAELKRRGSAFVMLFSDHGTAYGEEGYTGHRIGHEVVWSVPYLEFEIA